MRLLVRSAARPLFFPRIDYSHCDRIHSSLTAVHCFTNGYVGKQPVDWKEYCAEYWLKELQESMDRCTGRRDITEILLKTALNTIQSINQSFSQNMAQSYKLMHGFRTRGEKNALFLSFTMLPPPLPQPPYILLSRTNGDGYACTGSVTRLLFTIQSRLLTTLLFPNKPWPRAFKTFFMLDSADHEI